MKKFLVVLVIVAMTCMSTMAFAADVSVNGSIEMLMRSFVNMDLNEDSALGDNKNFTQERVRLNIDAKAGDALSGRIGMENDWDTWGRFETAQGNGQLVSSGTATPVAGPSLKLREAWIGFKVPGAPVGIKAGHMLLQLGNAWFFRAMKYGSDAWVVYTDIDALHLGIVNIKVAENNTWLSDDTDAYAFVATYKMGDTMSGGINVTSVNDRDGKAFTSFYGTRLGPGVTVINADLQNVGLHFSGKVGPVKLNAEVDMQMGDATFNNLSKAKFKGNQIVLQANMAMDPVTLNATLARGSGVSATDTSGDFKEYIALMDADVHYTLVYEYLVRTAEQQSFKSTGTGFGNTTAISLGAAFNASKNLMIGADVWMLQATEKVALHPTAPAEVSSDLGLEVDAKINWKLYENLTWNTTIGYFMPGDAYRSPTKDADAARAIQSVLSFKF
ncbi:MAG: hypothetical protein A2X58_13615 [Nitrospirae bacterium GWC2_56_14]|nr:MAG: hypothetical protein A2X58_13615 [Nitrospirae bacterium GWC2_56_14]